MIDKKYAFSIQLKSREYLDILAIDCDRRMRGVFIEGFLGELVDIKLVEDAVLVISGENGTFRLDINLKNLTSALSKQSKKNESESSHSNNCCVGQK